MVFGFLTLISMVYHFWHVRFLIFCDEYRIFINVGMVYFYCCFVAFCNLLVWLCLGQGADLHMVQLMPLPLTISCSSKSRLVLPSWCEWMRAVKWLHACVRACMCVISIFCSQFNKFINICKHFNIMNWCQHDKIRCKHMAVLAMRQLYVLLTSHKLWPGIYYTIVTWNFNWHCVVVPRWMPLRRYMVFSKTIQTLTRMWSLIMRFRCVISVRSSHVVIVVIIVWQLSMHKLPLMHCNLTNSLSTSNEWHLLSYKNVKNKHN